MALVSLLSTACSGPQIDEFVLINLHLHIIQVFKYRMDSTIVNRKEGLETQNNNITHYLCWSRSMRE